MDAWSSMQHRDICNYPTEENNLTTKLDVGIRDMDQKPGDSTLYAVDGNSFINQRILVNLDKDAEPLCTPDGDWNHTR